MTMAENTSDQDRAAETPPADHRPQPRYGELAPEGWSWKPPQEDNPPAASAPVSAPVTPTPAAQRSAIRPGPAAPGTAPGWDRPVTLSLLIFGLLATFWTIASLGSMTTVLQTFYTEADLGRYSPAPLVESLVIAGSISQVVIWVTATVISVMLLIRSRRAFYVPLVGGVVAFVAVFAVMMIIVLNDSTLLDYYGRP
jgi:hypothetical protein